MVEADGPGADLPAEVVALARRTGDLLVAVDVDRQITWTSDDTVATGGALADLLDPRDSGVVDALLVDLPVGPVVVRLGAGPVTHAAATAVHRPGGWLVQFRRPSGALDSRSAAGGGLVRGEQALDRLAWLLSATPRTGREMAVVGFDLDRLAEVNARYGQEVGDQVIAAVADRVLTALRSGDLVARLADDQFLAVLSGVHHLRGAIRVANKIRTVIEDPMPFAGGALEQTASVGVTLVSLGESVDAVLERVDAAVTMAKAVGGNVVRSNPPI